MKKGKEITIIVLSALLLILFTYAAISKLKDVQKFSIEVGQSPLLTHFVGLVIVVIPALELLISILFFFPGTRLSAFYLSFSLMTMFTAYIIAIMNWAAYIPCSCGGILSGMNWSQHLTFNIIFTLVPLLGILLTENQRNSVVNLPFSTSFAANKKR